MGSAATGRGDAMAYALEDALDKITGCTTIDSLQDQWGSLTTALGFACFTYVDARRLPLSGEFLPYHITTAPAAFIDSYVEGDYCSHDPVVRRGAISNAPFSWLDCPEFEGFGQRRRGAKSTAIRIMENAADFGFTQGYVIPCHAVDGQGRPASAFFSLYWQGDPAAMRSDATAPPWLRLAAATLHERVLELRGVAPAEPAPPTLTDRERECLAWACRGKTRGETADILAIGERTVEFHFGNAMKKLGVYNKFHAVAVAIQRGIVNL